MAAQTSASSSRASAKQAQRRAKRSESLSGSMRQFSPLKSGNKSNKPPASTVAGTGFAGHCNPSS